MTETPSLSKIKQYLLSVPEEDIANDILSLMNMLKNGPHSQEVKKWPENGTCATIDELLELLQKLSEKPIKQVEKILTVVHTGKRSPKASSSNRFVKEITGKRLRFEEDQKNICKMLENPIEEWLGFVPVFERTVRLPFQWKLPEEECAAHTIKKQKIHATGDIGDRVEQVPATIVSEPPSPVLQEMHIILQFDDGSNVFIKLAQGASFYIGRTAKADTDAKDCHVFVHEVDTVCRKVSTSHLNITNEGDGMKLRDTSSNGTWVNDEKIVKNAAIKLKDGDKVKLYNAKNEETVASAQFTVRLLHESNA